MSSQPQAYPIRRADVLRRAAHASGRAHVRMLWDQNQDLLSSENREWCGDRCPLRPAIAGSHLAAASLRGNDMKNTARSILAIALTILALAPAPSAAQDKPYKEGTVWSLSFAKVKPGMLDQYLREVAPLRKKIMDEAQKQGFVLSHKVLSGISANRDDWDIMFMDEYKNWAAFDGINDKFEAIEAKVIGNEEKRTQIMVKRTEVREIVGDKVMQELILK
jgi:hypothetical protein